MCIAVWNPLEVLGLKKDPSLDLKCVGGTAPDSALSSPFDVFARCSGVHGVHLHTIFRLPPIFGCLCSASCLGSSG